MRKIPSISICGQTLQGIEPVAVGWEAWTPPLCYAAPQELWKCCWSFQKIQLKLKLFLLESLDWRWAREKHFLPIITFLSSRFQKGAWRLAILEHCSISPNGKSQAADVFLCWSNWFIQAAFCGSTWVLSPNAAQCWFNFHLDSWLLLNHNISKKVFWHIRAIAFGTKSRAALRRWFKCHATWPSL